MKKFLLSLATLVAMAPAYAGTGTQADPYSVAEVRAMTSDVDAAYVKGYIVGCVDGASLSTGAAFEALSNVYSNVLIADSKDCTDVNLCAPIQLVSKSDIRAAVNLGDNPGNLGKEILIAGQITKYFGVMGIKQPTFAELSGTGSGGDDPVDPTERTKVASIAEFLAVEAGTEVAFTNPVNVVYQNGLNLYVQDATGSMFIYGTTNQTYSKGDVVPAGFEGKYTNYNGCIEFEIPRGEDGKFAASTSTVDVQPVEWPLEEISTDIQNHYVVIKDVTIKADGTAFVVEQDGTELTIYDKFKVGLGVGEHLNVTGFVAVFSNALQIYPIEITNASGSVVDAVEAPVFSVAAGAVEAGTAVEITCATEGASIYYTVDGTDPTEASTLYTAPVVVNEALTLKAFAVKDGMTGSAVVSASYTIKGATDPVGDGVVFDFTNPAGLNPSYDMANGEDDGTTGNKMYAVSDVWFTNGDVRVSGTISTTNTDARLYYQTTKGATQYRLYKGATLTIESTGDAGIVEVRFTFNNGKTSADRFSPTLVASDDVYVYEVSPASSSVEFEVSGSVQINKIEVVLEGHGAGVDSVAADNASAPVEYFNLQGVRVANPENGLYIRRQGNKVEKVVIR